MIASSPCADAAFSASVPADCQDVQDETAQISYTALPLVLYCAIQGRQDQGDFDSGNNVQNLGDAAGFDPAFVAPAAGNLRLLPDSPCLDNGDNTVQGLPADDLDGGARAGGNTYGLLIRAATVRERVFTLAAQPLPDGRGSVAGAGATGIQP